MKKVSGILLIINLFIASYIHGLPEVQLTGYSSMVITAALLVYLFGVFFKRYGFAEVVGWIPLCLLFVLLLIQLIPLPPIIVEALSPITYQLYKPVLDQAPHERWITLSIVPKRTLDEFFRYYGYVSTYILVQQLFSHRDTIKGNILKTVVVVASIALWFLVVSVNNPQISSFKFLNLLLLVTPLSFGLFLYYKPLITSNTDVMGTLRLLCREPGLHHHIFYCGACILMLVVLLVALQWSAVFSIFIMMTTFMIFYSLKFTGNIWYLFILTVLIIGTLGGGFAWDIWNNLSQKVTGGNEVVQLSAELISTSIEMIRSFPLFGSGLGSYEKMSPYLEGRITAHGLPGTQPFILRFILETGLVGMALLLWFLASFFLSVWKMIIQRGDRFVTFIGIGSFSGISALFIQSFVFPTTYVGETGFYLASIMGFTVAAVHCRFHYYGATSYCRQASTFIKITAAICTFFLLCFSFLFYGGSWYAGYLNKTIKLASRDELLIPIQHNIEQDILSESVKFDPLESGYFYSLARLELMLGNEKKAIGLLVDSALKNIMNGKVLQELAITGEKSDQERLELMDLGYRREPHSAILSENYGVWLFNHGKRKEALTLAGEVISLDFALADSWLPLLYRNMVTEEELENVFPPSVELWLHLAKSSEKNSAPDTALFSSDFYYEKALMLIGNENLVKPEWFLAIYGYYQKQNREDMAVLVVRRAITLLPGEAIFHRLLGDYFRKAGIKYRAIEEYERALMLDSGDQLSQECLREIYKLK